MVKDSTDCPLDYGQNWSSRSMTVPWIMAFIGDSWWTKAQFCWIQQWKTCKDLRLGGVGAQNCCLWSVIRKFCLV